MSLMSFLLDREIAEGLETVKSNTFIGWPRTAAPMVPVTAPLKSTSPFEHRRAGEIRRHEDDFQVDAFVSEEAAMQRGVEREERDVGRRAAHADFFERLGLSGLGEEKSRRE